MSTEASNGHVSSTPGEIGEVREEESGEKEKEERSL